MTRTALALVAALAVAGCGGGEERAAAPAPTQTPRETATPTPTAESPPERARSDRACAELWNAEVLPLSNTQVTASDFVAELAPTRALVDYQAPDCFVVVSIGKRRIAYFSADRGRGPYSVPERRRLKPGEEVPYNARARRDGSIELGG